MSKVIKGVGKVFKPVVKVVKKVAPVALMAAAAYFTAGAALGFAPATGWAGVASTLGGIGGSLAPVLTGAIEYAGYGALTGGAVAAIQGKNIIKGAGKGAVAGAITGGVIGGVSSLGAPAETIGQGAAETGADGAAKIGKNLAKAPADVSESGGGTGVLDWLENHKVTGGIIAKSAAAGIGALASSGDAKSAAKLALQRDREQAERVRANYAGYGNFLRTTPTGNGLLGTPTQPTAPALSAPSSLYDYEYSYNPETRRLERVQRST